MNLDRSTELKQAVINKDSLTAFINDNFVAYSLSKSELLQQDHSLTLTRFNRRLKDSDSTYKFFSLPVQDMYALLEEDDGVCLYIFVKMALKQLDPMVKEWGLPWNINADDYQTGDFDMALWNNGTFKISVMNNYRSETGRKNTIVIITDIFLWDLMNTDD